MSNSPTTRRRQGEHLRAQLMAALAAAPAPMTTAELREHLDTQLGTKQRLLLVARPASSSPAVGYLAKHNEQQKALIESALGAIEY